MYTQSQTGLYLERKYETKLSGVIINPVLDEKREQICSVNCQLLQITQFVLFWSSNMHCKLPIPY